MKRKRISSCLYALTSGFHAARYNSSRVARIFERSLKGPPSTPISATPWHLPSFVAVMASDLAKVTVSYDSRHVSWKCSSCCSSWKPVHIYSRSDLRTCVGRVMFVPERVLLLSPRGMHSSPGGRLSQACREGPLWTGSLHTFLGTRLTLIAVWLLGCVSSTFQ